MKGKLIWKTEEEMQEELKKRIDSYKPGDSKDGYVLSAEGTFVYRGIAYLVKVIRYFNHTNKFTAIGRDRISDSHAIVEYPNETKPLVELIPQDYSCEFLYHDTNHSWNDKQTVEEQIKECHKLAKADIDNLLDGEISKKINEGIEALQKIKDKLDKIVKKTKVAKRSKKE